ncbi:MAG: mannose-1-phosphate guanylyltransferase, partial [Sphaerochaetaceae bacterium]|nr:mannose-1-phosphate guanylyltransferase [Sphaerochaetaceae bacterium]
MTNIILCGGSGTRLWPISRTLMPKQFVKLFDDKSLFQLTVERNSEICDKNFIVSNAEQYFLSQDQLEELSPTNHQPSTIDHKPSPMDHEPQTINYLLEPVGRNTAPAIALACLNLDPEEIVLVSPSDHLIKNVDEYKKVLDKAQELASSGYLVTFGIKASSPEVGYGYIEASLVDGGLSMDVVSFHEKPDFDTALKYLEAGNYFWNSGIFCFKAGVFLSELEKYSKEIYTKSVIANNNAKKTDMTRIHMDDMLGIPEDSIDYAVMEKSSIVKVIGADIDWSDLGSFDALYDELPKDKDGNTKNANHISIDSKNNLIYGSERKIATVDMEDTIIVDTGDALLVSKKGSSQNV